MVEQPRVINQDAISLETEVIGGQDWVRSQRLNSKDTSITLLKQR